MYSSFYSSNNKINAVGCHWLGKSNWKQLRTFEICTKRDIIAENNIDSSAMKELTQASWPSLQHLELCNQRIMKWGAIWMKKVGRRSYNLAGVNSCFCLFVRSHLI